MQSVILVVIGFMCGGIVGLIGASVCIMSGNKKIDDENARMRKAIYKTHDELIVLTDDVIKKTGSYEIYKQLKNMQDELKAALEEG